MDERGNGGSREIRSRLRGAGLRATAGRLRVVRALQACAAPATHAEVARRLAPAGLDRATVFRILNDLTRAQLVSRRDLGDHTWRFEWQPARPGHQSKHPHFFCTACAAVRCLTDVQVRLVAGPRAPAALRGDGLDVQIRGRCDRC